MIDSRKYDNLYELGKDIFLKDKYDPEMDAMLKTKTVYERLECRYKISKNSKEPALVAKPDLFYSLFKPVPHPDYPSPWLTVSYDDFFKLVKACAYVIKRRFDLPPQSRVGIVANGLPMTVLITYALWYSRCTVVGFPPKLGNDVKQFWTRMLDIKMIIYDSNAVTFFDEEKQKELNDSSKWIWDWKYPLNEDEYDLSAGYKGIPMFCMNNKEFCDEVYQCSLEGKSYTCPGLETDVIQIVGTSSSSQAIIKNGHCSKMKFIPLRCKNLSLFQSYFFNDIDHSPRLLLNCPLYHMMGCQWGISHNMNTGGALIFHTQKLQDIGFVPENLLDDIVDVKPGIVPLFPFCYAEFKALFDENHPKCEIWKEVISSRPRMCFRSSGAPISQSLIRWFEDKFEIPLNNECGSSETGIMMYKNIYREEVPGEETALSRIPWNYFYLKPLDDGNEDEGELFVYSDFITPGYIARAKKGEYYESPIPGMRLDYEHEEIFETIDGFDYYKTNDIWRRSKVSGDYSYVARVDDVLTFGTGLKMNPLPFENTVSSECNDVKICCLVLDDTQNEIVCFIEPEWRNIIMEDGQPFDDTVNPESLSKSDIVKIRKIAQKQIWNSIYELLMSSAKSLSTWAKQLTINNIVIIDYGKKFPVTAKGSLSRRVAKMEYSYVLKKISKLLSGEIKDLDEEEEESPVEEIKKEENVNNEKTNTEANEVKIEHTTASAVKSQEEIDEEIQNAVKIVYESIKEVVPSTPDIEEFNIKAPFTMYSIDSLGVRKLSNVLSRKTNKTFSPSILFNYGTPFDLAKYITGYDDKMDNSSIPKSIDEKTSDKKIAVIGMALRLPGAINNSKSFWMALAKGRDCVQAPVKDRNLHTGYVNKPSNLLNENEHNISRCGCYDNRGNVAKPSEFDAEFFNCLPEEARCLDPRHRWVLETSWEALENSGIAPNSLENTLTGVFVGINDDHDYQDLLKENNITVPIATHSSPSGIVGRLSYFYKLFGPSFTIDTACSTGASALHSACRSLQFGDCDLSIVSGVKYLFSSSEFHRTSVARMTSPNGRCATFDKDADGFAPGEGCVTFVLKRYEDAIRDKDNILSVILGTCSGQSGLRQSISAPSSDGQALNLKRALQIAGVDPSQVSFVETHGTGTPLGDAIEVNALNQVYAGTHSEENPLVIGSIKTNIGHTNEAAGLASMAKVILAMQHKFIPKNLHFNTLNPEIDVNSVPIQIATKTMPWETKNNEPRIAQVSSFGLQGSIVHIILQEYIPEYEDEKKSKDSKDDQILTISAKTPSALLELCNNYLSILESMEDNDENIENLCYTSNVGRQHFEYRISASGKNASELYDDLEKQIEELEENQDKIQKSNKNGHGITQNLEIYIENGSNVPEKLYETIGTLYSTEKGFSEAFDTCDKEVQKLFGGASLMNLVKEKNDNGMSQVLIISFYYSLHHLIESIISKDNSSKTIYGGFGFGEIIGLVNCGGLNLTDALSLIQNGSVSESLPKLKKNIYLSSLDKEFKSSEVLSTDDINTIMKNINNVKDIQCIINKYGQKSKSITVYNINSEKIQEIIDGCSNSTVINFFEETHKSLFDQFVINKYNNGQIINWEKFTNETEKDVHKIELPTYPFQRSVYWPTSL